MALNPQEVHYGKFYHLDPDGTSVVIEFLPATPLEIHLCVQEILAWLDHWLNLVDYMNYLQETGSKHAYIHGYLV